MPRLPVERVYYSPTERLSREELGGLQWRRLKVLLAYAYNIPFYRKRFAQVRLTPDDIQTWEDFHRLPLITKADLIADQNEYPPFGSRLGTAEEKMIRFHLTAGTSGKGQQVLCNTRADLEVQVLWGRGFYWMGARPGDTLANLSPTSIGPMNGGDCRTKALDRLGVNHLHLGITYSTEQKALFMKQFNPHFLYSGVWRRLQKACQSLGLEPRRDFPRLKTFMGEYGTSLEEVMEWEDYWDARMGGFYGSTESRTGSGNTCEKGVINNGGWGQYHMWDDFCLFEFLDRDTREPVPFGEPGEMVVTNLTHEASPLIRFASNDKAIPLPPNNCDCGRPFVGILIGSIVRYDDMVKVRGMNIWPVAVDAILFHHPEVAEYQATVFLTPDGHEDVTVMVEFHPEAPPERRQELLHYLAGELQDKIGVRMTTGEARETLPRFEAPVRKPKRWTDARLRQGAR